MNFSAISACNPLHCIIISFAKALVFYWHCLCANIFQLITGLTFAADSRLARNWSDTGGTEKAKKYANKKGEIGQINGIIRHECEMKMAF